MLRILPLLPALVYIYASWIHNEDVGVSDFIKGICLFINLSDLYLQLHLCDIDNMVVSHVLPEQSGQYLHAHPDPVLPVSATAQWSQSL